MNTLSRRELLRSAALGALASLARPSSGSVAVAEATAEQAATREAVQRFLVEQVADDPGPRLGIVYFHWFAIARGHQVGQVPGPAIPADGYLQDDDERPRLRPGMLAWNGSTGHHRRHDLALIEAGFDTIVFQIPLGYARTQRNHFTALAQLKREGVAIPKLVPFIEAASYPRYLHDRDFHDPAVRDNLFQKYVNFFDRHFRVLGPEDLVWKDGRVFVHLWWIPGIETAPASLLDELSERCVERYGFRLFFSCHEYLAHLHPDRVDRLFNGVQPWRRDRDGNYSLMPGFFPPTIDAVQQGFFLDRAFGDTYRGAWDAIIENASRRLTPPEWVVVETANEIGECTSILPLVELPQRVVTAVRTGDLCTDSACVPPGAEAYAAGIGDDPMLYLRTTAQSWRALRDVWGLP